MMKTKRGSEWWNSLLIINLGITMTRVSTKKQYIMNNKTTEFFERKYSKTYYYIQFPKCSLAFGMAWHGVKILKLCQSIIWTR